MPNEKRDPSKSSSEKRSDQTGAVEIKLGNTAAVLLEFRHPLRLQKGPVHETAKSIAVAWTSGTAHDGDAFQGSCNDASVKTLTPANVRLAAVDRGDDPPGSRVVGEKDKVVLLNPGALRRRNLSTERRPPEG